MATWIIAQEKERRNGISQVIAELKGQWEFSVDGKAFTLTTRIDRLEIGRSGDIALIDYKTGTVASNLRYADPDATDVELWAALDVADCRIVTRFKKNTPLLSAQSMPSSREPAW